MKLFQIFRELTELTGIDLSSSDRIRSINLRSFGCLLAKVIYFSTSLAYLVLRANTPQEYGSKKKQSQSMKMNRIVYSLINSPLTQVKRSSCLQQKWQWHFYFFPDFLISTNWSAYFKIMRISCKQVSQDKRSLLGTRKKLTQLNLTKKKRFSS